MSDWKESSLKRRDARQTKVPVIRPPGGSKKDTKKWCRGVVGREHELVCKEHNQLKSWRVLGCVKCGKQLDYWFPSPPWAKDWWGKGKPPPEWVTF